MYSKLLKSALALSLAGGIFVANANADDDFGRYININSSVKVQPNLPETAEYNLAKMSLGDVANLLSAQSSNKIISIKLENVYGNLVYEVETLNAKNTITDQLVDAGNGKILATQVEAPEVRDNERNEGYERDDD